MSLSDLNDPRAVLRAIAEYDALGRELFLKKHGFRQSVSYFLVHHDRRYDSKAIAGVARNLQRPDLPPLRGSNFTGGDASVRKKLEALGFKMEVVAQSGGLPHNPPWTREETILALDLYARRRPQLPGQTDREIIELSDLLRRYGAQRGILARDNFRNPDGVSMKVANLSRLDSSDARKGLAHGAATEEKVWAEFMPDEVRLAATAQELRAKIAEDIGPPPEGDQSGPAASRGPRPTFGAIVQFREDGETSVYVMQLAGQVSEHFPQHDLEGRAVVKIGRSNDVARRAAEMNSGFPPGLNLVWKPAASITFATADLAHDAEQALLRRLESRGLAIGGEFAIVPEAEVHQLV